MANILQFPSTICNIIGCQNERHKYELNLIYSKFLDSLTFFYLPFTNLKIKGRKVIPGWNCLVKQFYHKSRECYLDWIRSGRKRDSSEFYLDE